MYTYIHIYIYKYVYIYRYIGLFKLKSCLPGVENARNKTNAGKTASKNASEGRRREARN